MLKSVAIVGAGQAGFQAAASLRFDGFTGRIALIGDEPGVPYQRPPLSKGYLLGKIDAAGLQYRPAEFYDGQMIERVHARAVAIDRTDRRVELDRGEAVYYDHMVLALGAHNRALAVPGAELVGVFGLRTLADADAIAEQLGTAINVVIVGAGFIGLELACVAHSHGASVHVLELGERPMARALTAEAAAAFRAAHEASGIRFDFHQGLTRIDGSRGRVSSVQTTAGVTLPADVVVFGIGVLPNVQLAAEAGLHADNGIKVDTHLLTSDPAISAIGDCASFPSGPDGSRIRLESVQNAVDQGRCVAARLAGKPHPYSALPWFWSDQGEMRLQIAGLSHGFDATVVVGDVAKRQFAVLCFRREQLIAVESVNRSGDHMAARKLLTRLPTLTPQVASEPGFDLRAFESATR